MVKHGYQMVTPAPDRCDRPRRRPESGRETVTAIVEADPRRVRRLLGPGFPPAALSQSRPSGCAAARFGSHHEKVHEFDMTLIVI